MTVVGRELVVDVGPPAHGGHAIARVEEQPAAAGDDERRGGRVVLVRHALPGERVRVRVTEGRDSDRYWRADAVEVLRRSPDRVEPPCPVAGPGGCGGCDLQHATPAAQRAWKAEVVRDVLARIGRLPPAEIPALVVESLPGRPDALRWRSRARFAVDAAGRAGLRRHRSHEVVPLADCPVAAPEVLDTGVLQARWHGAEDVAVAVGSDGRVVHVRPRGPEEPRVDGWRRPPDTGLVVAEPAGAPGRPGTPAAGSRSPRGPARGGADRRRRGRGWVRHEVDGVATPLRVTGDGFWQPHPAAPAAYVAAVREVLAPRPGETVADLYAGTGLFAAALAEDVGPAGAVVAVEADARAVADARRSLHDLPRVRIVHATVGAALAGGEAPPGGPVVLDPPRAGAGAGVVDAITGLRPRAVAYVACDPAALARDVARFRERGYRLASLRAFDAFPMTHHVECVAGLTPTGV